MITPRGNVHHSKLPAPGAVGHIVGLSTVNPKRRCIVSHYPLCDNARPYRRQVIIVWLFTIDVC